MWERQQLLRVQVSTEDLEEIGTQVELSNTYHLHVSSGETGR